MGGKKKRANELERLRSMRFLEQHRLNRAQEEKWLLMERRIQREQADREERANNTLRKEKERRKLRTQKAKYILSVRKCREYLAPLFAMINTKLTSYLVQNIIRCLLGLPFSKLIRASSVCEDCSSVVKIGKMKPGEVVCVVGPSQGYPPLVPIFPSGAIIASCVGRCESEYHHASVVDGTFLPVRLVKDPPDFVTLLLDLRVCAGIAEGCLGPGDVGEVLWKECHCWLVRCHGRLWWYSPDALERAQLSELRPQASSQGTVGSNQFSLNQRTKPLEDAPLTVIQDIVHDEPAAIIDPGEAQAILDTSTSAWIQHNIGASAFIPEELSNTEDADAAMEKMFVLQMTRNPSELHQCLHHGVDLEHVRTSLEAEGHEAFLACGASVFVAPYQYASVRDAIRRLHLDLKCYNVVVSETLLPLVEDALLGIPSRRNVRIREAQVIGYAESEAFWIVQNTFLAAVHPMRASTSVVQSTTEAHGGINPRRSNWSELD